MISLSSAGAAMPDRPAVPPARAYFETRRARVDAFVARHFRWPGTLRLHAAALGWDICRAPLNVALSPVLVLARIAGYLCRRVGLSGSAAWLARRRILLRTSVAQRVEVLVLTDLLDLPLDGSAAGRDARALSRAILAAPQFRELIRTRSGTKEVEALGRRLADALGEYAGTRSAVAEMTTAICALLFGALVFQVLTPGVMSMAPSIAGAVARSHAIETFPLGPTLGGMWYGVFDAHASPRLLAVTGVGLVMTGSLFAAFAGILADPVQSRLGIHRRRLLRLLDTLETEFIGDEGRTFAAREHFYARLLDLMDAVASILRIFRN